MSPAFETAESGPYCDKCGVEMTTAMMAVFCPLKAECEFFPAEPDLQEFITGLYPTEPPSAQGPR